MSEILTHEMALTQGDSHKFRWVKGKIKEVDAKK